jgi:hypothetical protein
VYLRYNSACHVRKLLQEAPGRTNYIVVLRSCSQYLSKCQVMHARLALHVAAYIALCIAALAITLCTLLCCQQDQTPICYHMQTQSSAWCLHSCLQFLGIHAAFKCCCLTAPVLLQLHHVPAAGKAITKPVITPYMDNGWLLGSCIVHRESNACVMGLEEGEMWCVA